jgi:ABC-type multidrug transport system fused ATPase/permease subunit
MAFYHITFLDYSSSAIDSESDAKLQAVIRNEFSDCTVLVIGSSFALTIENSSKYFSLVAHRLSTIMDSDKIAVVSGGEVVEYDTAQNLLQTKVCIRSFGTFIEYSKKLNHRDPSYRISQRKLT